jgi:hypothetical protein
MDGDRKQRMKAQKKPERRAAQTQKLTLLCDADLVIPLKHQALNEERSVSMLVSELIRKYLKRRGAIATSRRTKNRKSRSPKKEIINNLEAMQRKQQETVEASCHHPPDSDSIGT